jgi:cell division septum initiation protein DivIVA
VINFVPLTIESLVAILLLLTILYCIRLNEQLKRLKADGTSMQQTIAELLTATESAERAIAGLKQTVHEADATLGERLKSAQRFSAEMKENAAAGAEVLDRLSKIAGAHLAPVERRPEPAIPRDAKSIMAAAQAFAERTGARVRGRAA